ncbi:uncharacterized protein cubi_03255 [Cryptosporidium ubiquitum]|uniref:Uncharacterized protein n=1 Tax=Cryptosporidium ubiquitum TaxID=857276 RepID=A0A1J4MDK7_9CRYT|nr:uncharacterized protein cubi_03255 [Cryptosporidium ubiquitum]OII70957.1 hypothetical protein cubi_03255 [Cryptosporidium ubiquitum]
MSYSNKNRLDTIDTDHLGYVGIWPSNGKDAKVVPMGTPGVPLTDIYDEMMHSNGQRNTNKPAPIGDHSYPIPVPVPVITPRTRDLTRNVIQGGNKSISGSQATINTATLKPKRRSFESLRNKSQPPQPNVTNGPRKMSSKIGLGSNELSRPQRQSGSPIPNRRSLASVSSSIGNAPTGSKLKKSVNEVNSSNSNIPRRSNSVATIQKSNQANSDVERHKIPEDYVPRPNIPSCYSSQPNNNPECPTVPYPFSMDADGNLNDNFNQSYYQPQDRFSERPSNFDQIPQRRNPTRRVTQNAPSSPPPGVRNFISGKSNVPYNSNITHHRDYHQNYGDNYYNREELYSAPYYARSSSVDRPTLTNVSSLNPFDNCIPHSSTHQYNSESLNCYSVPNKYRNSVHDFAKDDMYADSASCLSPSKTLMYCSGEYSALEAERHIRQNYSTANEVFKPMVYETIVFPPGYFEYKKQLEELRKKYLLDTNPNAFYQMKQNGEFIEPTTRNGCIWNNGKNLNKKRSHPVFVKTTGTIDHLNRMRPNPACYC